MPNVSLDDGNKYERPGVLGCGRLDLIGEAAQHGTSVGEEQPAPKPTSKTYTYTRYTPLHLPSAAPFALSAAT